MAKKKTPKAKAGSAGAAAVALADAASACRLREIAGTPDFDAPGGSTVTLFTHEHIGKVLILSAEYGGQQLVPGDQAVRNISFAVKPGRNTLKLVFVFSAGNNGQGELREDCGDDDSHFLRALLGGQPFHFLKIFGN